MADNILPMRPNRAKELLEELLEKADDIDAIAVAINWKDDEDGYERGGATNFGGRVCPALLGHLVMLQAMITGYLFSFTSDEPPDDAR